MRSAHEKDFRILPEVADDIAQAADWYDEHGYLGLGDRFTQVFYSHIPHILESGEIHRVVYSDFRKILLQPFPYFLFYRYHEDFLVITLVIEAMISADFPTGLPGRDLLR